MKRRTLSVFLFFFVSVAALSCARDPGGESTKERLQVVTTLFVLYDFAKTVGGDYAKVTLLIPPGLEPHGFEPTPGDIARIQKADLFIYTGSAMEPWVDRFFIAPDLKGAGVVEAGRNIVLKTIFRRKLLPPSNRRLPIIYQVQGKALLILILKLGHRKNVYR